jgi:hypothetical protein
LLLVNITKAIIKPVVQTLNKKPVELFRLKKAKRNSKVTKKMLEAILSKLLKSQATNGSSKFPDISKPLTRIHSSK